VCSRILRCNNLEWLGYARTRETFNQGKKDQSIDHMRYEFVTFCYGS
jgi:hypothetical protein